MTTIAPWPLFDLMDQSAADRPAGSELAGLLPGEMVADLFCGAGGWGEGLRTMGVGVDFAVNHDAVAIGTHERNNPGCRHHRGDAWRARPRDVIGKGTRLGILFASAACTTHSRARGAAPISKRVHMLGWCIARWMREVSPRVVFIENVPEWRDWGPTIVGPDGVRRQDPKRKGQEFRRWWRYCERLGYRMEMRVLDAPDYGAACRRRRLFIIARRDGQPIVWPEPTHGPRLTPYRTAAEVIDWSDLGTSIFDRRKPLAPKTLARIAEGIRRYVLNDADPFVLRVTHGAEGGWKVSNVRGPLPTQTTRQDLAVVSPVIAPQNTGVYGQRVDAPAPTVTTRGHQSLIAPMLATTGYGERADQAARVHRVAELLGTCVNGVKRAVVSPILMNNTTNHTGGRVDGPMPTVTTGGQGGLVSLVGAVGAPLLAYHRHGGGQASDVRAPMLGMTANGTHAGLVAALLTEFYGSGSGKSGRRVTEPMGAVTTLDRHGLVTVVIDGVEFVIVDILFRMLRPAELTRAMGFRDDFAWPATQRATVRLIGNAVSPFQAAALIGAAMPGLRPMVRKAVSA